MKRVVIPRNEGNHALVTVVMVSYKYSFCQITVATART